MKIGIDAGHGGQDPGAIGRNPVYLEEEDVTLSVALELKSLLEGNGHQVVTTRTADTTVSLFQRSHLLNNAHVDLVVSIHVNAGSAQAKYVATFIWKAGGRAEKLARCVQKRLVAATGWPEPSGGGVRAANFHMVRETDAPAILVELGFISNPQEEILLNDPQFRSKLAAALSAGIDDYMKGAK